MAVLIPLTCLNRCLARKGKRFGLWGWLTILLTVLPLPARAQTKEYQIKAAFLYNFAQFVQWPAGALGSTNEPFRIGVLGDNPFDGALAETLQGETIDNHKMVVRTARQVDDLKNCQMIFISRSEKGHIAKILSHLDSSPILTVSEIDGFAQQGGIINFYLEGTKVRFEINPTTAQRDGLKISSELLDLGKIIEPAKTDP
jgi:YfiR/HmsC-like